MKLILDFDDVLFNTKAIKEQMFVSLEQRGVSRTQAEDLYKEYRKTGIPFSLKDFLIMISQRENHSGITDGDCYEEIMSICPSLVNKELLTLVLEIGRENLYIVTNGDDEFQKEKMRRSIGENFAQETIVVPGSKKEIIEDICLRFQSQDIIFADDKVIFLNDIDMEVCKNLKKVLFNEQGLEKLSKEVNDSRDSELIREVKQGNQNQEPKMN